MSVLQTCSVREKRTALDRGRTDRISLTYDLDFELYDTDLQSPASYGHDLGYTCMPK